MLAYVGLLLCMVGLVTSPAILSIGTVAMAIPAFVAVPFREQLRRFWWHRPAVFISLLFLVQILSGIWTREEAASGWLMQIQVKAPLLFCMYGLSILGPFTTRQIRLALILLLLAVAFTGVGTTADYILHQEEINERIQVSKEVKVWLGINHIYYSIVAGFSVLAGAWLAGFKEPLKYKWERPLIISVSVLVFLIMHLLTTRTGLVGMYLTGGFLGLLYVVKKKKYLLGSIALVVIMATPVLGYQGLPSFRYRVDNTWMDVSRYFGGKDPNYLSIGTRLESWKTAINIFRKHPLIGVGMADMWADMTDQYVEDESLLCSENYILPHNQFFRLLAGFGLLGFLPFTYAWIMLPIQRRIPRATLFWIFYISYTLAMLGESTVERQVGIMFLVTGLMLSLSSGVNKMVSKRPD
jgi:O-antigen ligase